MSDHDGVMSFPAVGDVAGLEPGETEVVPMSRPDDARPADRNDLAGLPEIPTREPVGLVDASTDASTQVAHILVDPRVDLTLDTFVVVPQRLVDDTVLFHYGIVTEAAGRVEGAVTSTDTARLAQATLAGEHYRRAEVSWIRTHPEQYLPPSSGALVWIAAGEHRRRALFLDKMDDGEGIPIGLDMNDEIVFMPYSFLNGDRSAHASISGKSGVATKTSYALFLLYMLFETRWGVEARAANPHDRALLFSVKGSDLCLLDRHSNVLSGTDARASDALRQWHALGVDDPQPFSNVAVYAPAEEAAPDVEPVPQIAVRDKSATAAYGWSPSAFVREGLLEYLFDDLESGQLSFIEQVVRTELLRWAHPLAGDTHGRLVLAEPSGTLGRSWEAAARAFPRKAALNPADGTVISTLDELVEFIAGKVTDTEATYDPKWTGNVQAATTQAFVRRLWKATPRLRRLVRAGLAEVDLERQVSVVDVHALHADAQRFVVASVLASIWSQHEDSTAAGRTFVVLDELNKYAPRQGGSPIKALLVDIAARGRSLGVILIGAQQNPSGVDRDIINNAALEVVGQIKSSEASELGFLPPDMRARAQIIAPGTMITSQPLLPAPVPIRFPFPPYATRYSEVLIRPEDDARGRELLDGM
jgi:DNA helicase HerA-like ATPase